MATVTKHQQLTIAIITANYCETQYLLMYSICLCCYIVEVQDVKQMATVTKHQQPTIAIITANYCEKLAVDAMMQDKTTFVKFKTNGMFNICPAMMFWCL